MKLIIDIPEETKQAFDIAESNDLKGGYYDHGGIIGKAIQNGTPLSKVLSDLKAEIDYETSYDEPAALACEDGYDRLHYGIKSCLDIIDRHINEMEG